PDQISAAEKLKSRVSGNGNGRKGSNPMKAATAGEANDLAPAEKVSAANRLLEDLANRGIVIQDWRRGLIDFPHIRDGEEVLLCYELADGGEIQFFHELDAGYAGRQAL